MSGFSASSPGTVITQYAQPTTGQTVTANPGVNTLFIDPAGTLPTLTIALPANPVEGQVFRVGASQIITSLTITGTIVGTLTSLALGGFAQFVYSATSAKWFRVG